MKKQNLIICPNCKTKNGLPLPLGEVADGRVLIRRQVDQYTIIDGKEFNLSCSICNEVVFTRETKNVPVVINPNGTMFL